MLQRLRRSMRRKKASYCVNCGHSERDCYHGEYANGAGFQRHQQFNSLPSRKSINTYQATPLADLYFTYDELVSWDWQ